MFLLLFPALLSTALLGAVTVKGTFNWPNESYYPPAEKLDISEGEVKFHWGTFRSEVGPLKTMSHEKVVYKHKDTSVIWTITLDSKKKRISVKEVYTLPSPSKSWRSDFNTKILSDQRTAVTTLNYSTDRGIISGIWSLPEDAPIGKYRYEIFYQSKLIYSVNFEVRAPYTATDRENEK